VKCRGPRLVHVDDCRTTSQVAAQVTGANAAETEVESEKRKLLVQSSSAEIPQLLPEICDDNREEYDIEKAQPPLAQSQSGVSRQRRSILFGKSPGHVVLSQKEIGRDEEIVGAECHVDASKKLNAILQERSASSALVILNLPDLGNHEAIPYMSYVDTLIHNLDRVVLVHSAGNEVFKIDD